MQFSLMWSLVSVVVVLVLLVGTLLRPRTRAIDAETPIFVDDKFTKPPFANEHENWNEKTLTSELPLSVTRSDNQLIERSEWVLRMTRHVFTERHKSRYNVVVINKDLEYHFTPQSVVEKFEVVYYEKRRLRTIPYEIVVFKEGALINMGDGGDINWDWQGNFSRSGNKMLIFKPCVPGVVYQQDPWVALA